VAFSGYFYTFQKALKICENKNTFQGVQTKVFGLEATFQKVTQALKSQTKNKRSNKIIGK